MSRNPSDSTRSGRPRAHKTSEVEGGGWKIDVENVLFADVEVRVVEIAHETRVDIDRRDVTARADAPAEHVADRSAAGADLEAPPSFPHADRIEPSRGRVVENFLEELEPASPGDHPIVPRV
jgi:hypothetical protein